jgi:hypothetical protein
VDLGVRPSITFNARIDANSLAPADETPRITLRSAAGEVEATLFIPDGAPTVVEIEPAAPLEPDTTYTLTPAWRC